ncbi:MAG: lipid-A-disaccharide synthase [Pseudomonadota bacterium]
MKAVRLVMVAGEASGDGLGADLIRALRRHHSDIEIAGIGGPRMAAEGMDCWFDASELSVMGLTEVLGHLPRLLKVRRETAARALAWQATAFIGIDAPDFNLGLARRLKARGMRAVHYVCPSIWAWRRDRARKFPACTDLMLTLFPFEPEILAEYGVASRFVGHPLADRIDPELDRVALRDTLGLPRDRPVVAVLPGSRGSELSRIGPELVASIRRLSAQRPDLVFVSPAASERTANVFREQVATGAPGVDVRIEEGASTELLAAADVAIVASGTATLEAVLTRTPMVVVYRIAPSTHFIVHALKWMAVDSYSLPNALAGGRVVPELMQDNFTAEKVTAELLDLLGSAERQATMREAFAKIHAELRQDASEQAAEAIASMLEAA